MAFHKFEFVWRIIIKAHAREFFTRGIFKSSHFFINGVWNKVKNRLSENFREAVAAQRKSTGIQSKPLGFQSRRVLGCFLLPLLYSVSSIRSLSDVQHFPHSRYAEKIVMSLIPSWRRDSNFIPSLHSRLASKEKKACSVKFSFGREKLSLVGDKLTKTFSLLKIKERTFLKWKKEGLLINSIWLPSASEITPEPYRIDSFLYLR